MQLLKSNDKSLQSSPKTNTLTHLRNELRKLGSLLDDDVSVPPQTHKFPPALVGDHGVAVGDLGADGHDGDVGRQEGLVGPEEAERRRRSPGGEDEQRVRAVVGFPERVEA